MQVVPASTHCQPVPQVERQQPKAAAALLRLHIVHSTPHSVIIRKALVTQWLFADAQSAGSAANRGFLACVLTMKSQQKHPFAYNVALACCCWCPYWSLPQEEDEFVDNEAGADGEGGEEGDEEGEGDGEGDGEGEGEGEEGSADSSEEEEGSEQNEYEEDGFVVDEEEAENDGGEDSDQGVRKKRRKRRRNFALDEEDYMLLEDNQVTVRELADG